MRLSARTWKLLQRPFRGQHRTVTTPQGPSLFWCGQVVFKTKVSQGSVQVSREGEIVSCHVGQTLVQAERFAQTIGAAFHNLGGNNECLSPGLVDVHVHISALGREWEGYASATKAAAAGGITTLVGMPLNSLPPTTSPHSVQLEKDRASQSTLYADVGLWGGVVPENCNPVDLDRLLRSGVLGLKAFLSPLPPAAGYRAVSPDQLMEAARICGPHDRPILVHSELMTPTELQERLLDSYQRFGPTSYRAHLHSRPPEWERAAVRVVCQAAIHCPMHVVHLSDAGCLDLLRAAQADRQNKTITVETCPHYLMLDSSTIRDGDTRLKCFPPIRTADNRERLWRGLQKGWIDMVASDHSPCPPAMRCRDTGDLQAAWGGLTGLQYQLPATWTEASQRDCSPLDLANWWSRRPSELAGVADVKGTIEPGKRADFCWWDPTHQGAPEQYSREHHRWMGDTVYASNANLRGRVLGTWLGGVKAYDGLADQHLVASGRFLEATGGSGPVGIMG